METTKETSNFIPENNEQRKIAKRNLANKIIFIEYESALPNGHFITVTDRFKNILSRIHRIHNVKEQNYRFVAYDAEGNLLFEKEKIWEMKKEFINQKEVLMEKAHQKRLEKLSQSRQKQQTKTIEKTTRMGKPEQKNQPVKTERNREQELKELRESKEQNMELEISR